jgi:hypothetical protein
MSLLQQKAEEMEEQSDIGRVNEFHAPEPFHIATVPNMREQIAGFEVSR